MDPTQFIGHDIQSVATPQLVVDARALEHNLQSMSTYFSDRGCKLRPHFKSHKCLTLAHRQLAAGNATGITCAKVSEAEVLVAGGIRDILIANQVVGDDKARRLAALNQQAIVRVAVDSEHNVDQLGRAAGRAGVTIGVLVEVDIGMQRCGVPPGLPVVRLAERVASSRGLRLDGLQGYEGHLVMIPDENQRREETVAAINTLVDTRRLLEGKGLDCPIVSGGSSSTYDVTGAIDGVDEVQAGSYALMDCSYRKLRREFQCAMNVLSTVISSSGSGAVTDVGLKGMGNDFGPPLVADHPEATIRYVAEEHTVIDNLSVPVGSRVRLIPSHGCTTCNLHRQMWIVRDEVIEAVWPIEGSGCLQ